jgi:putative glutamine amidotransferase
LKPVIALNTDQDSTHFLLLRTYWDAVTAAGGIPLFLPPIPALEDLDTVLESVDGLILTGGGDIDPSRYGAVRRGPAAPVLQPKHDADFLLANRAVEFGIPILGVCYGMQLLSVIHGGTLVQDIATEIPGARDHWGKPPADAEHPARLEKTSRVAEILGCTETTLNSHHHQAVKSPGTLRPTAWADDGVIEAVELPERAGGRFLIGLEWHPERMKDPAQRGFFRGLVEAAARYREGSGYDVTLIR